MVTWVQARAACRASPKVCERAEGEGVEQPCQETENDGEADEAPVPIPEAPGEDTHPHV